MQLGKDGWCRGVLVASGIVSSVRDRSYQKSWTEVQLSNKEDAGSMAWD